NGSRLIAGSEKGVLYSWNWSELTWNGADEKARKLLGHPNSIDAICPLDDETICTGGNDGLLRMISFLPKYQFEGILGDHGEDFPIECIKMGQYEQQRYLASCAHDLKLKFWNVQYLFDEKKETDAINDDETTDINKNRNPTRSFNTLNKFDPNDIHLDGVLENNKKWAAAVMKEDPTFLSNIAHKQEPKILWIGCSDSRVPANIVLSLPPGEVFVHRNIANVVSHSDLNCLSVLQYAVEVLKVEHIIVCGHYNCGGVTAAQGHEQFGLIDNWLRNIKDVYRLHEEELVDIKDDTKRLRRLIELNAIHSAENVCHSTIVQNAWKRGQQLTVHAWAFDIEDGQVSLTNITLYAGTLLTCFIIS
ncbi:carbonic anhydrase, partial [Mycotypha africana]|uniref:carbonic anhydrase n=1 Tax=Mycotypha africana TaxID=64632 RepID=UPI0023007AEE